MMAARQPGIAMSQKPVQISDELELRLCKTFKTLTCFFLFFLFFVFFFVTLGEIQNILSNQDL